MSATVVEARVEEPETERLVKAVVNALKTAAKKLVVVALVIDALVAKKLVEVAFPRVPVAIEIPLVRVMELKVGLPVVWRLVS